MFNSHETNKVFILSENHKDFPGYFFEPIFIYPISTLDQNQINKVYTPCVYQLRKDLFEQTLQSLNRT